MSIPPKSFGAKLYKQGQDSFGKLVNSYDRHLTERALFVLYVILSLPVWGGLLLVYLYWLHDDWVLGTLIFTSLFLLVVSWWQSMVTADLMFDEDMSFRLAMKATIYSGLMKLTFVPIIGPVFERLFTPRTPRE